MKWIIIAVVAVGIIGLFVVGSNAGSKEPKITYAEVQQQLGAGAKLYDVRTASEFSGSHFAGAVNLPLQDIENGQMPQVDKNTKIYVYCQSGNRSASAAKALKQAGFSDVNDLHGLSYVESMGGKLTKS